VSLRSKIEKAVTCLLVASVCSCTSGSYQNSVNGALAGATLGAGSGAIIGGSAGKAGPGIAIGAGIGALTGALAGSAVDRQADSNRQLESHIQINEQRIAENRAIIDQLKAKGADVTGTDRGVVINLPDILFEFDRSKLTEPAKRTIAEMAPVLKEIEGRVISVEGHTDSIGTVLYNKQLSERRASEVTSELRSLGINLKINTRGLGEGYPVATNNSEIGRSRNRRVEIVIENR